MTLRDDVLNEIDRLFPEIVAVRRELHQYPERSFREHRTSARIADLQRKAGLEVRTGVGGLGVLATLRGGRPGPTIAIRADFDALPIVEENDVPYASQNVGVMHACGHDAHTAIALGIARALVPHRDRLCGNIVFIHQHAEEEDPGGAKSMIADGALEGVDAIIATHMENYIPVGHIWHNNNYVMASSDDFTITVRGAGGHAAWPQDTVDAVAVGSQLVTALHQITSRKVDPLRAVVLTVGAFNAGDTTNVIASEAQLKGTVRTFDPEVRASVEEWVRRTTEHLCAASGAAAEITWLPGAPAIQNDARMNALVVDAAHDLLGEACVIEMEPNMGAEDFSFFAERVPAVYFFTGSANAERGFVYPYHHPRFDIDEESLRHGAKVMVSAALTFLEDGGFDG